MGKIIKPNPVKLIAGFIFKEKKFLNKAKTVLIKAFGQIDFESPVIAFDYTDYYEREFGKDLKRVFIGFKKLIPPDELAKIKSLTNKAEAGLSSNEKRLINIDPGYIDLAKLVLASTKDYSHRIYLGRGVFSEITLEFKGGSFMPRPWTYPDYASQGYISIFNKLRENYAAQIKNIRIQK